MGPSYLYFDLARASNQMLSLESSQDSGGSKAMNNKNEQLLMESFNRPGREPSGKMKIMNLQRGSGMF